MIQHQLLKLRSSKFTPGTKAAIGATIPAAVIIETVAEPVATRIIAAIPQPNIIGETFDPSLIRQYTLQFQNQARLG